MKPNRSYIVIASLLMLVSLGILLASPFSAFCHQLSAVDEITFSGDCCCPASTPSDETTPKSGGCCSSGSCCTACAIPLAGVTHLPEVNRVAGMITVDEPALMFPEVYLPIFVPPESYC